MYQNLLRLLLLLAIFKLSFVESSCSRNCDGHGTCVKGQCLCHQGYFPVDPHNRNDCSVAITVEYGTFVAVLRGLFSSLWFVALAVCAIGLYMNSIREKSSERAAVTNVTKVCLSLMIFLSVAQILFWSVDFYGVYGVMPVVVSYLLEGTIYPSILAVYVCVLLHWMDVYHTAVTSIKREEMLKQINSNYSSEVTVEDILNKVKFLKGLRMPFIIFMAVAVGLQISREIVRAYSNLRVVFDYLWSVYFLLLCVGFALGFLIYGRRLVTLMPDIVSKRMKRLTRDLTIFSISQLIVWIVSVIIAAVARRNQLAVLIGRYLIGNLFIIGITFLLIRMFTNFGTKNKFPFCFRFSSNATRQTQSSQQSTRPPSVRGTSEV